MACFHSLIALMSVLKNLELFMQAMGRALLLELERGRHAGEGFLLCRQLAASSDFAVLTEQHLLCIVKPSQSSAPALRWAVALRDVFHFDR